MVLSAEIAILIAFAGFALIFYVKVYPKIAAALDEYIESVKELISKAENMREGAFKALAEAEEKEREIEGLIEANRLKSEEKIERLREENQRQIKMLRERHEISLQNRIDAELVKQKGALIDRVSDLIIERVEKQIISGEREINMEIGEADLKKLLN